MNKERAQRPWTATCGFGVDCTLKLRTSPLFAQDQKLWETVTEHPTTFAAYLFFYLKEPFQAIQCLSGFLLLRYVHQFPTVVLALVYMCFPAARMQ